MKALTAVELKYKKDAFNSVLLSYKAGTIKIELNKALSCNSILCLILFINMTAMINFTG